MSLATRSPGFASKEACFGITNKISNLCFEALITAESPESWRAAGVLNTMREKNIYSHEPGGGGGQAFETAGRPESLRELGLKIHGKKGRKNISLAPPTGVGWYIECLAPGAQPATRAPSSSQTEKEMPGRGGA